MTLACVCFGVGEALGALVLCVCGWIGVRKARGPVRPEKGG